MVDHPLCRDGRTRRPCFSVCTVFRNFGRLAGNHARFAADFHVVAPDQRGYQGSFKPDMVEAYQARYLVQDLGHLADHVSPDRPFALAATTGAPRSPMPSHSGVPDRLTHLVIANGVHPVLFPERAILDDAEQRRASQYINRLRAPDAES